MKEKATIEALYKKVSQTEYAGDSGEKVSFEFSGWSCYKLCQHDEIKNELKLVFL